MILVLASANAPAQQFRGRVVDSVSGAPLAGAVVVALDSLRTPLERVLTATTGEFVVSHAAVAKLRVLRIGYAPREIARVADSGTVVRVSLLRLPTLLAPVQSRTNARCARREGDHDAVALWEQVRAALLAADVAGHDARPRLLRIHFERRLRDGSIQDQAVTLDSTTATANPFAAPRTPSQLVDSGFTGRSGDQVLFFGPDAGVLADDAFARGYCFRVVRSTDRDVRELGLAFAPAEHRRNVVAIQGTFWVDTVHRRLDRIDFSYDGLAPALRQIAPGGSVALRDMPNGTVLVTQWTLRMPDVVEDTVHQPRGPVVRPALVAREVGGELARADWPDGGTWKGPLGELHAVIIPSDSGDARAGIHMRLLGTPYGATTDSLGTVDLTGIFPGSYRVALTDAPFRAFGMIRDSTTVVRIVRDSLVRVSMPLPSIDDYMADACLMSRENARRNYQLVAGRVLDRGGAPMRAVVVSVLRGLSLDPAAAYITGSNGEFQMCVKHFEGQITVQAYRSGSYVDAAMASVHMNTRMTVLELRAAEPR